MRRLWQGAVLALLLAALAAATAVIDRDARGLLDAEAPLSSALDTAAGRALLLAVIHPDRDQRTALAREIAGEIAGDAMVADVSTGPAAPPPGLVDWLWRLRFVLAPPPPEAFTPGAMTAEMVRARRALTSMADSALAERYLLDPTGSFRRLVESLQGASRHRLPLHDGVAQALDDSAAIVAITLSARPFDVDRQREFDRALTARVEAGGAEALLVGPRSIAARISERIATRSQITAAAAGSLLLLWLVFVLRSARVLALTLLPVSIGLGVAILTVQAAFGSVHVISIGFGGALLGLAMDYPLHLLAHGRSPDGERRARRGILLGAITTALAFVTLVGAEIPAIGQVGVFVASGLLAAALAARWLLAGERAALRPLPVPRWRIGPRLGAGLLAAVIGVSGALLWVAQGETRHSLMETPPPIVRSVTALDRMVDLPSGRHRIDVSADDLQALLARQSDLLPVLDEATREGWIDRAEMLLTHLPPRPEQPAAFPAVETFAETLQGRLAEAGLSEAFRGRMVDAYREAREAPPAGPEDLRPLLETLPVAGLISPTETGLSASVRLWGVEDPGRLAAALDRLGAEGVSWTDEEARISAMLDTVSARLLRWFLAGAAVATVVLLAAFRSVSAVARIAGACLAGALATALAVTLVAGGLGLFQLVALALVVGLGIDYAIFVVRSEDDRQWFDAFRSILLCAATTLIAFIVMAFSGVAVLEDIGTTVVIGVSAMVVSALLLRPAPAQAGKR